MSDISIRAPITGGQWQSYFKCRWWLLRAPWGQLKGTEQDGDDENVWNWGVWREEQALGCVRLQYESESWGRLRYMAVAPELRGTGVGRQLVETVEAQARQLGMQRIVLDARQPAIGFYKKLGYQVNEPAYVLFNTIKHWSMRKDV